MRKFRIVIMLSPDEYVVHSFNYFLCESSQKGLLPDFPHMQRLISPGESSVSLFRSLSKKFPVIFNGPNSTTSIIA